MDFELSDFIVFVVLLGCPLGEELLPFLFSRKFPGKSQQSHRVLGDFPRVQGVTSTKCSVAALCQGEDTAKIRWYHQFPIFHTQALVCGD